MGAEFFVKASSRLPDHLFPITAVPERVGLYRKENFARVYVKASPERLKKLFEDLESFLASEGFCGKVLLVDYGSGYARLAVFEAGRKTCDQQKIYDPAEIFCEALERNEDEALEIAEAFARRLPEKAKELLTCEPKRAKELLQEAGLWSSVLSFYGKLLDVFVKYALSFGRLAELEDVL